MIRNTQSLTNIDTTRMLSKTHPERSLRSLRQSREALPQRFNGRIPREVLPSPTIPDFIQQTGLAQRLNLSLFSVHGNQQVVRSPPQVTGGRRVTVLHEAVSPQHPQKGFLRQIVSSRSITPQHPKVSPDAVLVSRNQLGWL